MWNGSNQPPVHRQQRSPGMTGGNRDDQLHMDAVSALTSLGFTQPSVTVGTAGGGVVVPSTNVNGGGGATNLQSYVSTSAVAAAATSNPLLMQHRHYSEDYTNVAIQQQQPPHYYNTGDDPVTNALYSQTYNHNRPTSAYYSAAAVSLNGGAGSTTGAAGHTGLLQVQQPILTPSFMPQHPPVIVSSNYNSSSGSVVSAATTGGPPLPLHNSIAAAVPPPVAMQLSRHASSSSSVSNSTEYQLQHQHKNTNHTSAYTEMTTSNHTGDIQQLHPKASSNASEHKHDTNDDDDDDDDYDQDEEDDITNVPTIEVAMESAEVEKGHCADQANVDEEEVAVYDKDDDDNQMNDKVVVPENAIVASSKPRGKPEAAARALAAANVEKSSKNRKQKQKPTQDGVLDDSIDAGHLPVSSKKKPTGRGNSGQTSRKPSSGTTAKKATTSNSRKKSTDNGTSTMSSSLLVTSTDNPPSPLPLARVSDNAQKQYLASPTTGNSNYGKREYLIGEYTPNITESEYKNLREMMIQFCRVPLLSEFSRPVAMLHPEVMSLYSKIISHPIDLGHVCRGIRRRQYTNCRDVRLDVWRVFANCVKYNAHPSNKEAVPSFVSIALHLRDYFNNLWQEFLLPSDPPRKPKVLNNTKIDIMVYDVKKAAFAKRNEERKKRLDNSGVLVLSKTFTTQAASLLLDFIDCGGRVDALDKDPLFGPESGLDGQDVELVIQRLRQYHAQLVEISESGSIEYTLDTFYKDLTKCYTDNVLDEDNLALQNRFRCRLDRFFWKQAVPLHEANSRGVTQSSIWGNLAATIWARESSKKPFWPALCLGILPPAEQREGWHQAITERNESRLPEKLRTQLMVAKKRCEQAQKRQSLSYFLVEFLGTHEFIWVRETDIIENFDPNNDPNKTFTAKKSRQTSSVIGSKIYATAIQECVWASEEYENVLQDAFENTLSAENDDEDDDINFSFHTLSQSDDELDQGDEYGYQNDNENMEYSDVEESNYLISHDGMFDPSRRKIGKKRSHLSKKQAVKKDIEVSATVNKDDPSKKKRSRSKGKNDVVETTNVKANAQPTKKDTKDLDRRRKKRLRDHEKLGKLDARKKVINKRRRTTTQDAEEVDLRLVHDKQTRATAIVKAYLIRLAKQSDSKSLALSGVMTMPSAMVDSTGILGMALAFRAASGGLCMPDDGKEQLARWKPWVVIDSDRPKTSAERVQNLKKKIELVQKEISSVRSDTEKRRQFALEYVTKRANSEFTAETEDSDARLNHFKKRKKFTPSKNGNASEHDSPDGKMCIESVIVEPSFDVDSRYGVEEITNDDTDDESDNDEPGNIQIAA